MSSIINGLFAGRSGIASHGQAIAVIGDNISNSSTPGYKAARAEFEDLVAGGQAIGRITGSGSQLSAVSTIMNQGTLEFTGRTLDLAVDGNGFFAVQDTNGQKFYTRAGNFRLDTSGNIINPNGMKVMGFPEGGTGSLEAINVNTISQANVGTSNISIAGNLDARATAVTLADVNALAVPLAGAGANSTAVEFADIANLAAFTTTVDIFDSLGQSHTVMLAYFKTGPNTFISRAYASSEDLGESVSGYPRQITTAGGNAATGTVAMNFSPSGLRVGGSDPDVTFRVPWGNGSDQTANVDLEMGEFTQYASQATIASINQDGQGIGNVTSLVIEKDGTIFARLSNGQTATVGKIGLVNFSNPEGLARVGNNLLQQSPSSGEPLAGRPQAGTLGSISSGSIELSTVDIANEFVKMITLQRGFQANSRIITTVNQLLNEIIQLV